MDADCSLVLTEVLVRRRGVASSERERDGTLLSRAPSAPTSQLSIATTVVVFAW